MAPVEMEKSILSFVDHAPGEMKARGVLEARHLGLIGLADVDVLLGLVIELKIERRRLYGLDDAAV